jgi:hypothetical protein
MNWTYRRGRWTSHEVYPLLPSEQLSQERLRIWGYQRRWLKHPELGPVPEKWMVYGPSPTGVALVSELLKVSYLPPIRHFFNQENVLVRFLKRTA